MRSRSHCLVTAVALVLAIAAPGALCGALGRRGADGAAHEVAVEGGQGGDGAEMGKSFVRITTDGKAQSDARRDERHRTRRSTRASAS